MATKNGTEGNDKLKGTPGDDVCSGLGGNDMLDGAAGNDMLDGGTGSNVLIGGPGNDTLTGGTRGLFEDDNSADYSGATGPITVTLAAPATVVGDGSVGTDTLLVIDDIVGTRFNDTFSVSGSWAGGQFKNIVNGQIEQFVEIWPGAGNDDITVELGAGGRPLVEVRLAYREVLLPNKQLKGATIDLQAGLAMDPNGGTDTFSGVRQAKGTNAADVLYGSGATAWLEVFRPRGGNDLVDGRGGPDRVDYRDAPGPVVVDLAAGTASDGFGGTDTLMNVERAYGSIGASDDLRGDANANDLRGFGGNDKLTGRGGDDNLDGGDGDDSLDGGDGNDTLIGGRGYNTLVGGAGNDVIGGGLSPTQDRFTYQWVDCRMETGPLTVVLGATSTASGGGIGTDTLGNVDAIIGGPGNDSFTVEKAFASGTFGSFAEIEGMAGDDKIIGRGDTAISYRRSPNGVRVDLDLSRTFPDGSFHTAEDGHGDVDRFSGVNFVYGSDHDDAMFGGPGDETFRGHKGNDMIDGGGGVDRADYRNAPRGVVVKLASNLQEGGKATDDGHAPPKAPKYIDTLKNIENVRGSEYNDQLTGDIFDNTLVGLNGDDTLDGGFGNDRLDGGAGKDTMIGGGNNDTYVVDDKGDKVTEAGIGTDTVESSITYVLGANLENLTLTGAGAINGSGNTLANVIVGNTGANVLSGLAGNDTLTGGAGNDVFVASVGNDTAEDFTPGEDKVDVGSFKLDWVAVARGLVEDAQGVRLSLAANASLLLRDLTLAEVSPDDFLGLRPIPPTKTVWVDMLGVDQHGGTDKDDALYGLAGDDELAGGVGKDCLVGDAGDDVLDGGAGDDMLDGGAGDDTLDGGTGKDTMIGGAGDDTYVVDDKGDKVTEAKNGGTDRVVSSLTYVLGSEFENLTLTGAGAINGTGNALGNVVEGGAGNNILLGLAGNDTLRGAAGNDRLDGGAGNDGLEGGAGNDVFVASVGTDTVEDFAPGQDKVDVGSFRLDWVALAHNLVEDAQGVRLSLAANAGLLLRGLTLAEVSPDDFLGLRPIPPTQTVWVDIAGEDQHDGTDKDDALYGLAGDDRLAGGVGKDSLFGEAGDDKLGGGAGDDKLDGGAGSDTLDGGTGKDTMTGGAGDDTYVVDDKGDKVTEAKNGGTDTVVSSLTYTLGNELENLTLTGTGLVNGTGNALGNVVEGGAGNNILLGLAGNDTLRGAAGNDRLDGGLGNDILDGGTGHNTVVFSGNWGNDLLLGLRDAGPGDRNDVLFPNLPFDYPAEPYRTGDHAGLVDLKTGAALSIPHLFTTESAWSAVFGKVVITPTSDVDGFGIPDIDEISRYHFGTAAADDLTGLETTDAIETVVWGGLGNDTLDGPAGNTLFGGGGNDTLYASPSLEVGSYMSGGSDSDTYVIPGGSFAIIVDGGGSPADRVDLTDISFAGTYGATVNGRHLVLFDDPFTLSTLVVLIDYALAANRIEEVEFDDRTLSSDLLITALRSGNRWAGNASWSDAGVAPAFAEELLATARSFAGNDAGPTLNLTVGGTDGNDTLGGFSGSNVLIGGRGNDVLIGGGGADKFYFAPGDGADRVTDFLPATDGIVLEGFGIDDFAAFKKDYMDQAGADVVIGLAATPNGEAGDSVTLENVDLAQLTAGDFVLS